MNSDHELEKLLRAGNKLQISCKLHFPPFFFSQAADELRYAEKVKQHVGTIPERCSNL